MQLYQWIFLFTTVIRYMRKRKETRSQITYPTDDNMIFRIFNKETIIITCLLLDFYVKNIDNNDTENQKTHKMFLKYRYVLIKHFLVYWERNLGWKLV
jgi:hypothetical protein